MNLDSTLIRKAKLHSGLNLLNCKASHAKIYLAHRSIVFIDSLFRQENQIAKSIDLCQSPHILMRSRVDIVIVAG